MEIPDYVRNAKFLGECAKFAKSFHIQMLRNIFVHNVIEKLRSSLILFDIYIHTYLFISGAFKEIILFCNSLVYILRKLQVYTIRYLNFLILCQKRNIYICLLYIIS